MKSKKVQKLVGIIITGIMIAILVAIAEYRVEAAPEGKYVCKLAHPHPVTAPTQKKALFLKKRWEEVTNGQVKVEIYPVGQLYKGGPESLDAASMGAIQMALGVTSWLEAREPEWAIPSLPLIIDGPEHWLRVENTPYVIALKKRMETSARLKLFSNMVFVSFNIYSKKPITKLEDLHGMKIRSFGPVLTKALKRMGASPMDIASPEVAVALQTGAISGVVTSPNKGYIQSFGMAENSPYILLTPIIYNIGWWAINSDWWNGLPPDIQKSLERTSDEIRSEVLKIEAEDESSTLKWATQVGMKTTRLSAEEIAKCKGLMKPLYDEYISSVGKNLFDSINKAR